MQGKVSANAKTLQLGKGTIDFVARCLEGFAANSCDSPVFIDARIRKNQWPRDSRYRLQR